eukprot:8441116-Pyramimonas_sp.AAC.2
MEPTRSPREDTSDMHSCEESPKAIDIHINDSTSTSPFLEAVLTKESVSLDRVLQWISSGEYPARRRDSTEEHTDEVRNVMFDVGIH